MSTSDGWAEKEDPTMTFEKPLERERMVSKKTNEGLSSGQV